MCMLKIEAKGVVEIFYCSSVNFFPFLGVLFNENTLPLQIMNNNSKERKYNKLKTAGYLIHNLNL